MANEKLVPFSTPQFEAATSVPAATFIQREGGETVTMVFKRPVTLTLDTGRRVKFEAGPQEVPAKLSTHWYLKACGATLYAPAVPKVTPPDGGAIKDEPVFNDGSIKTETEEEEKSQRRAKKR
jgi:hypothetical protein